MKYLRKNPRVDNLAPQQRAGKGRFGRVVYMGLLGSFFACLGYYLLGDTFVLSLDGIVLKERRAVDASYPAKVIEVFVKEGDRVEAGTPLVRLESFDMVKEIADLALRDGELAVRQGQLQSKLMAIEAVWPLAERTEQETRTTLARFDKGSDEGVVSVLTRDDALRGSLHAAERLAELSSQRASTRNELDLLSRSRTESARAMARLRSIFDDGNVRAAAPGFVGAKVPLLGQVVRFGDQLMQINGGKSYVLAYLPDSYLFSIREGMPVSVHSGVGTVRGRVEDILSVADALPDEFQNQFRPRDRSRLIRVELADANPFAVSQKVTVTGCMLGFCWVR